MHLMIYHDKVRRIGQRYYQEEKGPSRQQLDCAFFLLIDSFQSSAIRISENE
jgi:hypothetical protein